MRVRVYSTWPEPSRSYGGRSRASGRDPRSQAARARFVVEELYPAEERILERGIDRGRRGAEGEGPRAASPTTTCPPSTTAPTSPCSRRWRSRRRPASRPTASASSSPSALRAGARRERGPDRPVRAARHSPREAGGVGDYGAGAGSDVPGIAATATDGDEWVLRR